MTRVLRAVSLFALAAAIPAMAGAQTPPKPDAPIPPKTEQLDPNSCGQDRATIGQGTQLETEKSDGRNLSEKLAQSGGVLCPPAQVDPAIKKPAPEGGRMPVIPPPGSPGNDPNVQPK